MVCPLDHNAIVKPHDHNRFQLAANVLVKILGINMTKAGSGLWKKEVLPQILICLLAVSQNMLESSDFMIALPSDGNQA